MSRLWTTVAFALVLIIGLQMAACLASGDCIRLYSVRSAVSADFVSDCDGCGCCHLHLGFHFTPPVHPPSPVEFLERRLQPVLQAQSRPVPYRPPRS